MRGAAQSKQECRSERLDMRGKSSDFQFLSSFLESVGDEAAAQISAWLRGEETIADTARDGPG